MKKIDYKIFDINDHAYPQGALIANQNHGLRLHQGHIQGTFPTRFLRPIDEERVLDITATLISSPNDFEVALANDTLVKVLNGQTYDLIALMCKGRKERINDLCEEIMEEKALSTYKNAYDVTNGPSKWSPYYRGVVVEPKGFVGLFKTPIRIAFYREDLLRKTKD